MQLPPLQYNPILRLQFRSAVPQARFSVATPSKRAVSPRLGGWFEGASAMSIGYRVIADNLGRLEPNAVRRNKVYQDLSFENGFLVDLDFQGAKFSHGTNFKRIFGPGIDFKDCYLPAANFENSIINGADFTNAHLNGARFASCSLKNGNELDVSGDITRKWGHLYEIVPIISLPV